MKDFLLETNSRLKDGKILGKVSFNVKKNLCEEHDSTSLTILWHLDRLCIRVPENISSAVLEDFNGK